MGAELGQVRMSYGKDEKKALKGAPKSNHTLRT
jgi:hypothetical protein